MSYVFKRLGNADVLLNAHDVHKSWALSLLDTGSVEIQYLYGRYNTGSIDSSELVVANRLCRSVFSSIKRLYYSDSQYNIPPVYGPSNIFDQRRIYSNVDVLSVPQKLYGSSIRPNSLNIIGAHDIHGIYRIIDDGYGNLLMVDYSSFNVLSTISSGSSYTSSLYTAGELEDSKSLYFDSRQMFWLSDKVPSAFGTLLPHTSKLPYTVTANGVYNTLAVDNLNVPYYLLHFDVCKQSGSQNLYSHILVTPSQNTDYSEDLMNPRQQDSFAIVFHIRMSGSIASRQNIIDKGRHRNVITSHYNSQRTYNTIVDSQYTTLPLQPNVFPYNISVLPSNRISFTRSDGNITTEVTSSVAINDNQIHSVICQKSGSVLQVVIDGASVAQKTDQTRGDVHNNSNIMIGGDGVINPGFVGEIMSFCYFDRFVTDDERRTILGSTDNTVNSCRVGNVIYDQGQIIVTDPRFSTILSPTSHSEFILEFESTKRMNELEAICTITDADCNVTQNNSVRNMSSSVGLIQEFATHSNFIPYITNVGLYNDEGQLMMVGKPTHPIPKIPGIDITFILRSYI